MKSYHIVKKFTLMTVFSTLALVIFNLAFLGLQFYKIAPTKHTKAAGTCDATNQPATIAYNTISSSTLQINLTRTSLDAFTYEIKIVDPITGGIISPDDTGLTKVDAGMMNPEAIGFDNLPGGTVNVVTDFVSLADPNNPCQKNEITNSVNLGGTTAGLNLSASPTSATTSTAVTINFSFPANYVGQNYSYSLKIADSNNQLYEKKAGTITAATGSYSWTPEENIDANHEVELTVTDSTGTEIGNATASVCVAASSDPTYCSDGGIAATSDTADLTQTSVNAGFDTAFKLPTKITGLGDIAKLIEVLVIYFAGVFAFISLVIGGIQFITSGGDPNKVAKGKKTLLYSIIGIIVAVLALSIQLIAVNFWKGLK